jgi:hypothetical protein
VRTVRGLLIALALAGALALPSTALAHGFSSGKAGRAAFKGEQRVLVVLVTWGPQRFSVEEVRSVVFAETDAFMRASSFGQTWLSGDVTPWLTAFVRRPECDERLIREVAREAATQAGFDVGGYDRVMFLFPRIDCRYSGLASGDLVYLNGSLSRKLVAHELGHTYGLGHANTWDCTGGTCTVTEYGDPYDTMGRGSGDFNAFEKFTIGWLTNVTRPTVAGDYTIGAVELPSTNPYALVVTTASSEFWLDLRSVGPPNPFGSGLLPPGVLVHAGPNPAAIPEAVTYAEHNLLLPDPARLGRAVLFAGETFEARGAFRATVVEQGASAAKLRFAWTDTTRPRAPKIVGLPARIRPSGALVVSWEDAHELGSGVAAYEVKVDRGRAVRVPVQFGITPLARFRKPRLGAHTVSVVAIDRAGNRSAPSVRRFTVTKKR